jgi:hypothetical protein
VAEVERGVVRRLHDLAVGDADTQTMVGGRFLETRSGTSDESAGAPRIEDGLLRGGGD